MGYYIKGTSVLSIFDPKDQLRRQPLLFVTIQSHANYDNMDVECSHS